VRANIQAANPAALVEQFRKEYPKSIQRLQRPLSGIVLFGHAWRWTAPPGSTDAVPPAELRPTHRCRFETYVSHAENGYSVLTIREPDLVNPTRDSLDCDTPTYTFSLYRLLDGQNAQRTPPQPGEPRAWEWGAYRETDRSEYVFPHCGHSAFSHLNDGDVAVLLFLDDPDFRIIDAREIRQNGTRQVEFEYVRTERRVSQTALSSSTHESLRPPCRRIRFRPDLDWAVEGWDFENTFLGRRYRNTRSISLTRRADNHVLPQRIETSSVVSDGAGKTIERSTTVVEFTDVHLGPISKAQFTPSAFGLDEKRFYEAEPESQFISEFRHVLPKLRHELRSSFPKSGNGGAPRPPASESEIAFRWTAAVLLAVALLGSLAIARSKLWRKRRDAFTLLIWWVGTIPLLVAYPCWAQTTKPEDRIRQEYPLAYARWREKVANVICSVQIHRRMETSSKLHVVWTMPTSA
jgi:hypothetical protein